LFERDDGAKDGWQRKQLMEAVKLACEEGESEADRAWAGTGWLQHS